MTYKLCKILSKICKTEIKHADVLL